MTHQVHIVGGGLAGSEAAWQLARRGIRVRLSEMRGTGERSPAHQTDALAELVCSNSFRSDDDENNAVGLLHHEMRQCGSLVMAAAAKAQVPAGSALAVDRDVFSAEVEAALAAQPTLEIVRERIDALPDAGLTLIATGPLTAEALAGSIGAATGADSLAFFDAIAPIVYRESIDMDICWMASRWDKGETKDYINCPMTREQYQAFHAGLVAGEKTVFKQWEANTPYFQACMPIEVMAERGEDTLRFGPMKPVGLDNPHDASPAFPNGRWPYAVVQLRQDNKLGTLWNMVGFQTKLKHAEQIRLFRTIPGLGERRICPARRAAPQHLPQFAGAARPPVAAQSRAAYPLRRADHRLRGLCRKRRRRADGRADGGGRAGRRGLAAPSPDHRDGRAAGAYHRRCRGRELSADERQLRPVPAAARGEEEEPQAGLYRAG